MGITEGNGNGGGARLMALRAKIAVAEATAKAAKAAITEEDQAEIELRASLELAEKQAADAEQARRELDLDRRFDAAREQFGENAKVAALAIDGYPDTFVLVHDSKAYATWEDLIARSASNKKIDRDAAALTYAVAVVSDWNGITDWNDGESGHKLNEYLKANRGIVSSIVNAAAKLAGSFQEARKSTT